MAKHSVYTTHVIFKSGRPQTLTRLRALAEPRPHCVGVGWVVKCREKGERLPEQDFVIELGKGKEPIFQKVRFASSRLLVGRWMYDRTEAQVNRAEERQACRSARRGETSSRRRTSETSFTRLRSERCAIRSHGCCLLPKFCTVGSPLSKRMMPSSDQPVPLTDEPTTLNDAILTVTIDDHDDDAMELLD